MSVRVNLPVSYRLHGYLPGRRQPRTYIYAEMRQLEIEEVSRDEAPVAVEWTVPVYPYAGKVKLDSYSDRAVTLYDENHSQHTVYYDGRHWERFFPSEYGSHAYAAAKPVGTSAFAATVESGFHSAELGFSGTTQGQKAYKFVERDPEGGFDSVTLNTRESAMERFDELRLLSVEGVVYVACSQPCYKLVAAKVDGDTRRIPFVDVRENLHRPRFDPLRTPHIPFSHDEEIAQYLAILSEDVWSDRYAPVVHVPESISPNEDLRVAADFHIQEFQAHAFPRLGAPFAPIADYFQKPTAEDKADYLLESESMWSEWCVNFNLSPARIRKALDLLEGTSIGLEPLQLSGPRP